MRVKVLEHSRLKFNSTIHAIRLKVVTYLTPSTCDTSDNKTTKNVVQTNKAQQQKHYALPSKDSFDLYLLIGQSNMSGRAEITPKDQIPDPRVMMLNDNDHWVPAIDPVHTDFPAAGVGLCRSFARELTRQNESITVGLIPCATGGSLLERWQCGGDLYERAVKRTTNAMKDGRLKGILLHHGEKDSIFKDNAKTYGSRLTRMIADLRSDLGEKDVPVIVGSLGEFIIKNPDHPHAEVVNKVLIEIPNRVDNTACVHPIGLNHNGDHVHFSRESLEAFGFKYAQAITQLQLSETASAANNEH